MQYFSPLRILKNSVKVNGKVNTDVKRALVGGSILPQKMFWCPRMADALIIAFLRSWFSSEFLLLSKL
jgi:hypothetical protein